MSFYDIDSTSNLTRVEQLVAKDLDGILQTQKVSEHSPGPVGDHELLARSLEYPNKFYATGGLNESLFQDAFTHGASAQRLPEGWSSHEDAVHQRFEKRSDARRSGDDGRKPEPENRYIGAFHMTAAELKACKLDSDSTPRVRVYDAGKASDELHAEIIVDATGLTKVQRKEMRVRLMSLAQQRGLYVSPHLPENELEIAKQVQCELHLHTVVVIESSCEEISECSAIDE